MAIQVSGTEVISNARALTNVASIDATTAASITAGGVGGSTVKLVDNVAITSASTLTVSFSATYSQYRITMSDIWSTTDNDPFFCRLTNSSGTLLTGNVYDFFGSGIASEQNYLRISLSQTAPRNQTVARFRGMDMTVMEPYATNTYTYVNAVTTTNNTAYVVSGARIGGGHNTVARNNSIVFQFETGSFQTRGRYSVWGIK
jgi:hypothetical protein